MQAQKKEQSIEDGFLSGRAFEIFNKSKDSLEFISIGVGCFAFTLIERAGILTQLIEIGSFSEDNLCDCKFKNLSAIKSALISLCLCKVLIKTENTYTLTNLGTQLANHSGLITMVFEGYGELMAKGSLLLSEGINHPEKLLNGAAIAVSSIQFGERAVDPIVIEIVNDFDIKGTICDLGCGSADRLFKLCKATLLPGLGLDSSSDAIKIAKKLTYAHSNIRIEEADVAKLAGIWEDVQILMQCFMTHDIYPDDKCIQTLSSYRKSFPNLKKFIIVDIVAPEEGFASYMPAYDYVHGLLGIETRKYARFKSLFSKSGYTISEEISLDMPNTFLWVLEPNGKIQ